MSGDVKSTDFVIVREFDAPRELLWQCFTQPDRMKEWWGPKGSTTVSLQMDLRVGGTNLGAITAALARLLERYGAAALQDAILEALLRDVPHPNAVRLALERQREQQGGEPPVAIVMPAHVRDRDAPVRPHALETYDQLKDQHDATRSDD